MTRCIIARCKFENLKTEIKKEIKIKSVKVANAIACDKQDRFGRFALCTYRKLENHARYCVLNARYIYIYALYCRRGQDSRFASDVCMYVCTGPLINVVVCIIRSEPPPESHVAYVTRRASSEPRDSRSGDGERQAEAIPGCGGGSRSVSKQSGHLVELSRKPTAEQ